jgi:hypothetical protein
MVILLGIGAHQMAASLVAAQQGESSLSPAALQFYSLGTVMRVLAALILSLIFTLSYATLAGKSSRPEMVLIPLLDVLQSVPILGFREHLIRCEPLTAHIRHVLDEREEHPAPPGRRFEFELEDHLHQADAEKTLRAAIASGRYAEL